MGAQTIKKYGFAMRRKVLTSHSFIIRAGLVIVKG